MTFSDAQLHQVLSVVSASVAMVGFLLAVVIVLHYYCRLRGPRE